VIPARALLFGYRPYLTYTLVAMNITVWVVGLGLAVAAGRSSALLGGGGLSFLGGLSGPRVAAGDWWRILTSGFLHGGLIHLGLNMAALAIFGPPLERALGRLRFAALYLAALVAGSLGVLLVSPGALTVGASGAIFGLMGAIIAGQRASGIDLRSSGVLGLLVVNLVFSFLVPGISIGGHLGGLAGGFLAGSLLFSRSLRGRGPAGAVLCLAMAALTFVASLWLAGHPLRA
jgi:membrane associated rhomboid family serine protease